MTSTFHRVDILQANENDILHRFFTSRGTYEKHTVDPSAARGGIPADGSLSHPDGVRETLSPAMDILVSSNFERLLWYAYQFSAEGRPSPEEATKMASVNVTYCLHDLKTKGRFTVSEAVWREIAKDFDSERVTDDETVATIKETYRTAVAHPIVEPPPSSSNTTEVSSSTNGPNQFTTSSPQSHQGYILDPHSAVGIHAAQRHHALSTIPSPSPSPSADSPDRQKPKRHYISLATAHPAKFANAVDLALKDEPGYDFEKMVMPEEFRGLGEMERRVRDVPVGEGIGEVKRIIEEELEKEGL